MKKIKRILTKIKTKIHEAFFEFKFRRILSRIHPAYGRWIFVGKGWHKIILDLDKQLAKIDPNYQIDQIKEKFGGLRYYCTLEHDEIGHALIKQAEEQSFKTCERCGVPGSTRKLRGWLSTLCDKCLKKRMDNDVGKDY